MSDILNKTIVLVLNRNWQAINIRTPQDAFCEMTTNVATALDIEGDSHIRPVTWDEWITLPVREGDHAVRTARGEGTAGRSPLPQRPRRRDVEAVPEGMKPRESGHQSSLSLFETNRTQP